jgi:membrane-associated phospholipid phosphatase
VSLKTSVDVVTWMFLDGPASQVPGVLTLRMPHLRMAEWINALAFSWFVVLAWSQRSLARPRRLKISGIGASGLGITIFVSLVLPRLVAPLAASVTRDWLPYLLFLMFYWQAGQLVTRADAVFEARLERLDSRVVAPVLQWVARRALGAWILTYLESAYLFCYVSVPLGLTTLYLLRKGRDADHFWTVVLLATYTSYGMLPFIQTRPPRMLGEKWSAALPAGKMRALNLWVLRHASIHANTFPSGHVASSTACALVLLRLGPLWVGLGFLLVAISIALGAVAGRYHYAADAILGFLVASAAFLADIGFRDAV